MKTQIILRFSRQLVRSTLIASSLLMLLSTVGAVSQAYAWYSCNNGWTLQIRGGNNANAARCLKPETNKRVYPNAGCPVGTTFNTDYKGNTDYCLPLAGSLMKNFRSKCGPGQSVSRRNGGDRCYVKTPSQQRPVDRNIA